MQPLLIQRSDFDGHVVLSEHCAEGDRRWEKYAREVQNLDMRSLLGNCFFGEILKNKNETKYSSLLDGGLYTVDGEERTHFGIRAIMVHYIFASYIYRGGMVDTPFSVVQKISQDSIPVPVQELRNMKDEHRHIAYEYWKMTQDYLCWQSKEDEAFFGCYDNCNCPKDCDGCGDSECSSCKGGSPMRTRTYKLKVIKK